MNNDMPAFDQFMKDRELAAQAFVNGATGPLRDIATETSPATFFGPDGDYVDGADRVFSRYERDAGLFESGTTDFEILQAVASGDLAFWVGFQRATVRLRATKEEVTFNLRVTELFRREDNGWKLIHRHADSMRSGSHSHVGQTAQAE
jgi:ketosteroid isomerase-like protein